MKTDWKIVSYDTLRKIVIQDPKASYEDFKELKKFLKSTVEKNKLFDPDYMLEQIEHLAWKETMYRQYMIFKGIDMDEVERMVSLDKWVQERIKRRGLYL